MDVKDAKVLVATPNYTNSYDANVYANHMLCNKVWSEQGINWQMMVVGRDFVHFARTKVCQAAVAGGWTHIYWLDDDALVDPESLKKFIEYDKDVVVTPYPMRRSPFQIGCLVSKKFDCECGKSFTAEDMKLVDMQEMDCPECGKPMTRDFHDHASYRNLDIPDLDAGLLEIDGGGTHAMLVKVSVLTDKPGKHSSPVNPQLRSLLERLNPEDRDILDHNIGELPSDNLSFKEDDDAGKKYFWMPRVGTEDMLWCYRAKAKGFKVWCDTDAFADHMGFAPVITRKFREKMYRILHGEEDNNGVAVLNVEKGRDHTKVFADRHVNLV